MDGKFASSSICRAGDRGRIDGKVARAVPLSVLDRFLSALSKKIGIRTKATTRRT